MINLLRYISLHPVPLSSKVLQHFGSGFLGRGLSLHIPLGLLYGGSSLLLRRGRAVWTASLSCRGSRLVKKSPGDSEHGTPTRTKWARKSNNEVCLAVFQPSIAPLRHALEWTAVTSHPTLKQHFWDLPGTGASRHPFSAYLCALSVLYPPPPHPTGAKHYPERNRLGSKTLSWEKETSFL